MDVVNDIVNYKNLKIVQNNKTLKLSLDAILLSRFVNIKKSTQNILDIGTGNAPIPIILSKYTSAKILGIEIQKESYRLALESIKINNLEQQIEVLLGDAIEISQKLPNEYFDIITCNPPYFKFNENSKLNDLVGHQLARHEITLSLDKIFEIAKRKLVNKGAIYIVNRAERFTDIVTEMKKNNIEPKIVQFIHSHINDSAKTILIKGIKNGKSGIKVLSPIFSHDEEDNYTDQIKKYFS